MLDLRTTKNPRGLGERIGNALTYVVKMRYLYLMCIPGLIYLFIFHYMPMYGVIIAFKDSPTQRESSAVNGWASPTSRACSARRTSSPALKTPSC